MTHPLVLMTLQRAPGEPLQSEEIKIFVFEERACDCAQINWEGGGPEGIFSQRRVPGYVPKVYTTPFRDPVVNMQGLPPEEADPLALQCPVHVCPVRVPL